MSSSHDLHPKQGARFVFTRTSEDDPAPNEAPNEARYAVDVFLPGTQRFTATLSWDERGKPQIEPAIDHDAVLDQLVKLARVLKRTPNPRMTRWRSLE